MNLLSRKEVTPAIPESGKGLAGDEPEEENGRAGGIRTRGLLHPRQALYQAEPQPENGEGDIYHRKDFKRKEKNGNSCVTPNQADWPRKIRRILWQILTNRFPLFCGCGICCW